MLAPTVTPTAIAACLQALREGTPLVQCLTNQVVMQWTANALLAAGASPAMVHNTHESAQFAAIAQGVLVNLGTPCDVTVEAMRCAVTAAAEHNTPWVLDPVAAGALTWRTAKAHELIAMSKPTIVRGNASEINALAGGDGGRGVDSTASSEDVADSGKKLAKTLKTVVAISGEVDVLTDGTRVVRVANGHEWLTLVTGAGCALGALMAACAAVTDDALVAATSATALLTVAADVAVKKSSGPGSFAMHLLDELHAVHPEEVGELVALS